MSKKKSNENREKKSSKTKESREIENIVINGIKARLYKYPTFSVIALSKDKVYTVVEMKLHNCIYNSINTIAVIDIRKISSKIGKRIAIRSPNGKYWLYAATKDITVNTDDGRIMVGEYNVDELDEDTLRMLDDKIKDKDRITMSVKIEHVIDAIKLINLLSAVDLMYYDNLVINPFENCTYYLPEITASPIVIRYNSLPYLACVAPIID